MTGEREPLTRQTTLHQFISRELGGRQGHRAGPADCDFCGNYLKHIGVDEPSESNSTERWEFCCKNCVRLWEKAFQVNSTKYIWDSHQVW